MTAGGMRCAAGHLHCYFEPVLLCPWQAARGGLYRRPAAGEATVPPTSETRIGAAVVRRLDRPPRRYAAASLVCRRGSIEWPLRLNRI
jgi:hypothetical protein